MDMAVEDSHSSYFPYESVHVDTAFQCDLRYTANHIRAMLVNGGDGSDHSGVRTLFLRQVILAMRISRDKYHLGAKRIE